MTRYCPQCGIATTEDARVECPNCKSPLPAVAPEPMGMASSADVPAEAPAFAPAPAAFTPPSYAPPPPPLPAIPFEDEPGVGTFFATIKLMLTAPQETLRRQRTGEGMTTALVFFLLIQIPAVFMGQIFNWAMRSTMKGFMGAQTMPSGIPPDIARVLEMIQNPTLPMALGFACVGVIFGLIGLFINAGIVHFIYRLLGGGKEGFGATLKAFCYSIAPMVFAIIPMCGNIVGGIWSLVLHFINIGPAHREETGKGAIAMLLYFLLCCICICGFYFILIAGVVGMAGAAGAAAGR